MNLLDLLYETVKNPVLNRGQVASYDGYEWQVIRQSPNQLGWFWKRISGRLTPEELNKEHYFMLDHPIYEVPRYLPKASQKLEKEEFVRKEKSPEIKVPTLTSPVEAYEFTLSLGTRYKPAEELIKKSSKYAYLYAKNVLKSRFLEGENKIAEDPLLFGMYSALFNLNK